MLIVCMSSPFGTQNYWLYSCQHTAGIANYGALQTLTLQGAESVVLALIPLLHRVRLVLSTSCCWSWLTSAMTSLSCRRRYSSTRLTLPTLRQRSFYLRNLPAIQRPWTWAPETTTQGGLRQETWWPPGTFILSTASIFMPEEEKFSHLQLNHLKRRQENKTHHWGPRQDTY